MFGLAFHGVDLVVEGGDLLVDVGVVGEELASLGLVSGQAAGVVVELMPPSLQAAVLRFGQGVPDGLGDVTRH